jgi:hypothetical protein
MEPILELAHFNKVSMKRKKRRVRELEGREIFIFVEAAWLRTGLA